MTQLSFTFPEPNPPTSFRWPQTLGAKFQCSVVPEKRDNKIYWYMRKTRQGKTVNLYVAPLHQLSDQLLDNAVEQVKERLGVA